MFLMIKIKADVIKYKQYLAPDAFVRGVSSSELQIFFNFNYLALHHLCWWNELQLWRFFCLFSLFSPFLVDVFQLCITFLSLQQNTSVLISFLYSRSLTSWNEREAAAERGSGGRGWRTSGESPRSAYSGAAARARWLHVEWIMNELWLKLETGHVRGQPNWVGGGRGVNQLDALWCLFSGLPFAVCVTLSDVHR